MLHRGSECERMTFSHSGHWGITPPPPLPPRPPPPPPRPPPQNSQTHSNNLSAKADNSLSVFDHLVGLALKEFISCF